MNPPNTEEDDMRLTLVWNRLRKIILDHIEVMPDYEERGRLLTFMSEHWHNPAPRQHEFHLIEHRMRICEKHIEGQRERIKQYKEAVDCFKEKNL